MPFPSKLPQIGIIYRLTSDPFHHSHFLNVHWLLILKLHAVALDKPAIFMSWLVLLFSTVLYLQYIFMWFLCVLLYIWLLLHVLMLFFWDPLENEMIHLKGLIQIKKLWSSSGARDRRLVYRGDNRPSTKPVENPCSAPMSGIRTTTCH